ncbi:MAG: rod shape-determining protein MreC, partial [Xanthomonadaceae bacterium]|nr:rod shape-determining protein MreC [Xanthomonadaceae bacterium]
VGVVTVLRPDDSPAFLLGDLRPAAYLDRGRDVLLLRSDTRSEREGDSATTPSPVSSEAMKKRVSRQETPR